GGFFVWTERPGLIPNPRRREWDRQPGCTRSSSAFRGPSAEAQEQLPVSVARPLALRAWKQWEELRLAQAPVMRLAAERKSLAAAEQQWAWAGGLSERSKFLPGICADRPWALCGSCC